MTAVAARARPRIPVISSLLNRIEPEVGLSSPAIRDSSVVLPQPDGPSSTTNWPSSPSNEKPLRGLIL
jgi:hypothetical protein